MGKTWTEREVCSRSSRQSSHHSSATHGAVQGSFVEDAVKEWAVVECEQGVTDGNLLSCP